VPAAEAAGTGLYPLSLVTPPVKAKVMRRFIVRRLLLVPFLLFGMTVVTFSITHFVPTDPVVAALGPHAALNNAAYNNEKRKIGLDEPVPDQYFRYMDQLLHGDLGTSNATQDAVATDLGNFFPATVELAIAALTIALLIGIPIGIVAAAIRGSPFEQFIKAFALIGVSTPAFVAAFIAYQIFYLKLGWAGGPGALGILVTPPPRITGMVTVDALLTGNMAAFTSSLQHLALPAIILGLLGAAYFSRVVRQTMIEALESEAIRTARGKGLTAKVVFFRHAFRLSLTPTLSVTGLYAGELFAGAITVEAITGWHGVGQYLYNAAVKLDFPAVMGGTLVIGIAYVAINLVIDLLYVRADPRVRLK
jgi:peptide/nickel transport system permease protein